MDYGLCRHEYERYFPQFMKIIGRDELITDPNIIHLQNERCAEIIQILEDGFSKFTRDELDTILVEK